MVKRQTIWSLAKGTVQDGNYDVEVPDWERDKPNVCWNSERCHLRQEQTIKKQTPFSRNKETSDEFLCITVHLYGSECCTFNHTNEQET